MPIFLRLQYESAYETPDMQDWPSERDLRESCKLFMDNKINKRTLLNSAWFVLSARRRASDDSRELVVLAHKIINANRWRDATREELLSVILKHLLKVT